MRAHLAWLRSKRLSGCQAVSEGERSLPGTALPALPQGQCRSPMEPLGFAGKGLSDCHQRVILRTLR